MSKIRVILWVLIAWPLPALLAGAMGWHSVWGGGNAMADFLIPFPVAGGMLHVPSFVACGLIAWGLTVASPANALRLRALLLGMAVAGVLLLLRLDQMLMALQTQSSRVGSVWDANALGLFVLCDALVALALTAAATQGAWLRVEWATVLLALFPAMLPLGAAVKYAKAGEAFLPGVIRQGPARSDEIAMVFTTLTTDAPDFQARAQAWADERYHPRLSVNSDDAAILFTRNLDAARNFDTHSAVATLCLFEDGTPPQWLPGNGTAACFDTHVSFSERFSQAHAARPPTEPPELKDYMARVSVCGGVKTLPPSGDTGGLELSGMRICSRMAETYTTLLTKYPELAPPP